MIIARQSTARIVTVGPVLDADGVAVTDCVVSDFKISKNGGAPAALNGSATLTHRHTGHYSLSLTTSDFDTVGVAEITIDDTVNSCGIKEIIVVEEAVYDALFAASANAFTGAAGASKISGVVLADTVTTLSNLPTIPANWLTAAGIAATALNGKGDWNIGKTGYSLTNLTVSSGVILASGTHNPQSGDSFARLGANGAGLTSLGDTRLGNLDATVSSRATPANVSAVEAKVDTLLSRITANLFSGITYLSRWLGALAGKTADTTTRAEINATTAGATYNETTDSLESIRDRGDAAWTTGSGGGGGGGSGARTVTITVTVDSVIQEGARVRVTKGAETYILSTNVSGAATFNLDDGTWTVAITAPSATFAGASLAVDADASQTYDMDAVSLSPSDPERVTAYYLCLDENGDPESGVEVGLSCEQPISLLAAPSGLAIDHSKRTATSGGDGVAEFTNVVPGFRYKVHLADGSTFFVNVPQDADDEYPLGSVVGGTS